MGLNQDKLISIARGAALAGLGAALAYLGQQATQIDLGPWGLLVAAAISSAINALRKFAEANQEN